MPYFDDDGNELDPRNIRIPELCTHCDKIDDPNEEILCNLNRLDQQDSDPFECGAYRSRYGALIDDIIE
jgi:hypothetical protein